MCKYPKLSSCIYKNINSALGVIASPTNITPTGANGNAITARNGFTYDPVNNGLWYGGTKLAFYNLTTGSDNNYIKAGFHMANGNIHDDIHDIIIRNNNGQHEMFIACDGGIAFTNINLFSPAHPNTSVYFTPLNYGLNVYLLNGFSGTDNDPNLYALGGQDIVNTDIYDAATGKNRYTFETWENDGAHIDKFDKNKMFFDANSYNAQYLISEDGGASRSYKYEYNPDGTASFFKAGNVNYDGGANFCGRQFFQDPYRPGRFFLLKRWSGISQFVYDSNPNKTGFVQKVFFSTIDSDPNGPNSFHLGFWIQPKAVSFSPQSINSFHFITDGYAGDNNTTVNQSRPSVIKYIGNNIDDCWRDHNMTTYTDNTGTHLQWASITLGLWESLGISTTDMWKIQFSAIETSPWNKDVVYVSLRVPNHPDIKVLKYNGSSWSNYSNGIPTEESVSTMIIDYGSNDALYLSTEKGVYYKDAYSPAWIQFSNGLPKIVSKQMEINYAENSVRAGTYGRGIWKSPLMCPSSSSISGFNYFSPSISPEYNESVGLQFVGCKISTGKNIFRASTEIKIEPGSDYTLFAPANGNMFYQFYIHGCSTPGNSFKLSSRDADRTTINSALLEEIKKSENEFMIYPNPNNGQFTIIFREEMLMNEEHEHEENEPTENKVQVQIFDLLGKMVFEEVNISGNKLTVDISAEPKGVYFVKVLSGDQTQVHKIINQ